MRDFFAGIGEWFSDLMGFTKERFADFKFSYALEILLIAVAVYMLVIVFFNKRTNKMLICAGIYTLIFGLGNIFDMTVLQRYFTVGYPIGMIAIIIIFRNDCRESIEEFIRNPFGKNEKRTSYSELDRNATEIVAAAEELASENFGALIVIERSQMLDEIVSTGIKVGSRVSSKILRTIFYRGTPLHDGAVVIRGNKIEAARCFLPLSDPDEHNEKYDLGTRHLAAMGMAKRSDAVILVVSEETQIISIACGENLVRGYAGETLKNELMKLLVNNVRD